MPSYAIPSDTLLALRWQPCAAEKPPSALLLQPGLAPQTWAAVLARSAIWGRLGIAQGLGWQVVLGAVDDAASEAPLLPNLACPAGGQHPLAIERQAASFLGQICGLQEAAPQIYVPLHWRLDAPTAILQQHFSSLRQQQGCPMVLLPVSANSAALRLLRLDQLYPLANVDLDTWNTSHAGGPR